MTTLVGRAAESQVIAELLDGTAGDSAALIIEGEPGIGKTTLWLKGVDYARQGGVRVLAGRASAAESVMAYAALADLLAEVDRGLWADLPEPQRRGLSAALVSEDETALPAVDQRAVGAAFLRVLGRLAAESPVLLAIDDLQWLDASSAAAVAFAAKRLRGGVRLLCTVRSEPASARSTWLQLPRPESVIRLPLAPLTISELQDVFVARLESTVSRSRLLRIHQVSGGNPFYALELAREFDRPHWGVDLKMPDSLAELTHSRINRLSEGADDALLAIACLADAAVGTVAQALDLAPPDLLGLLGEAETKGVVAIEGNALRFTHPLLAHAVHTDAPPPRRRAMHRRLAAVVTEPELRARHLALADPIGQPETLNALDAAADTARARGAPAAAAELLELAIGLGGGTGRRRILLAQCMFDAGDARRARAMLETAITDMAPEPQRAEALHLLALVCLHADSFIEATDWERRALADCAGDDSALRVNILTGLAFDEVNTGAADAALATIADAVDSAERLHLSGELGRALSMRAMLRFMRGDGVDLAFLNRAVDLETLDGRVPVAFRPSVQRALLLAWTGELGTASDALAQLGARCVALGEEGEMMFIAFHLVLIEIWRGDLAQAADVADDALERARQLGGDAALFIALTVRGAVAVYQGRVEEARSDLADAVAAATRSGSVRLMEWPITMQGFLELSLGNHARALAALAPILPMLQIAPDSCEIIAATFVPDAAEALISLGRHDEAEPLVEALERNGARLNRAWMLAVGGRCRAMLCAARGDVAAAVVHAQKALGEHDRIAMPFERARTLLLLGRLERRSRHRRSAIAALTEALTIFEAVGTPLWAAQARADLARGTAGRTSASNLTPTEQRVAELVGNGLTNKEIATNLFITPKTVDVNLTRIYHKLGVHSRIELYRVMNSRPVGASGRDRTVDEPDRNTQGCH
jgi:DNA-binding CsgD family transcriptional regulator/tetratricopeptide (TPR) repeat protein